MKLLAPNGKPSNLTAEQYRLVRTPAFKQWFGDWEHSPETSSKVVDENGEPLVVYHGTSAKFTVFDTDEDSKNRKGGTWSAEYPDGYIFMTSDKNNAKHYGQRIIPLFVNMQYPTIKKVKRGNSLVLPFDDYGLAYEGDAIVTDGIDYVVGTQDEFLVKLADGSNTTFDGSNPDIRFAKGGKIIIQPNDYQKYRKISIENKYDIEAFNDIGLSGIKFDSVTLRSNPDIRFGNGGGVKKLAFIQKNENGFYWLYAINDKGDNYKDIDGDKRLYVVKDMAERFGYKLVSAKQFNDFYKIDDRFKMYENRRKFNLGGTTMRKPKSSILLAPNGKPTDEIIVFESTQIKLADGTNTTFDGSNPDIRYAEGGIPVRYKNLGFTKVGEKKKSSRPEKKWMVLAKKDDKYKVVHGGYKGMEDYTQHKDKERRKRFWDRMGGINSKKANDKFSPLYWHKKFGTWKEGGILPDEIIFSVNNLEYKDAFLDRGDEDKETWKDYGKKSIKFIIDKIKELKIANELERKSILALVREFKNNPIPSHYAESVCGISKRYLELKQSYPPKITDIKNFRNSYIPNYNFINKIDEILNSENKYELGGELTLTSEQVENKLGRELHWWNDDVVTINGTEYKKVFLKPEYKKKVL